MNFEQDAASIPTSHIPVIDFTGANEPTASKGLGKQLVSIFQTVGFVYLKNHGVPEATIRNAMEQSRIFFELPLSVKLKYQRPAGTEANSGYVYPGMEKLNAFLDEEHKKRELREAYNFLPLQLSRSPSELPEFAPALTHLYKESAVLTRQIFGCLIAGLQLKDKEILERSHKRLGQPGNPTTLRTLWYPPFDADSINPDEVTRCGTHSDYGTLTLLYQDDVGGLEVENRNDEFVPAVPLPGCVLVNLGDLLQRWTSDKLRSTRHRVGFRATTANKARQSMAFFVHPDDDFVVTCLDGSDKYPPVTAGAYLQEKFSKTY